MYLAPLAGIVGLYGAGRRLAAVRAESAGDDSMQDMQRAVRAGAMDFLSREARALAMSAVAVGVMLAIGIGSSTAMAFMFGAACSMLVGYRGMIAATDSNGRAGEAARGSGERRAAQIVFGGAAVMGLSVASVGLVGIGVLYWFWGDPSGASVINGFALGASWVALFVCVGGGLFAGAAAAAGEVAVSLAATGGRADSGNPGVIADGIGGNVGDVAGAGADLFASYCGSIIATIAIAATMSKASLLLLGDGSLEAETLQSQLMMYPLVMAVVGLFASIGGLYSLDWLQAHGSKAALGYSTFVAGGLFLLAALLVTAICDISSGVWWAVMVGTVGAVVMGLVSGPSAGRGPTRRLPDSSETGTATNRVESLAVGLQRCALPLATICASILIANAVAGVYGIGVAAVGMLATVGFAMTLQACGPIADNAGRIARMTDLGSRACEVTDRLGVLGMAAVARCRGLAIGGAALSALALLSAYAMAVNVERSRAGHAAMHILVNDPKVLAGLFFGGTLPFLAAGFCMTAAGRLAGGFVDEVRRQSGELPGLVDRGGEERADAARCVAVPMQRAVRAIVAPGLVGVAAPVIVGLALGPEALGGMLAGATVSGVLLATSLLGGGSRGRDNAWTAIEKHEVETQQAGTRARRTAVVGDIVGDSFNDTAGRSMNILIKLMSVVSLVIAPLLA